MRRLAAALGLTAALAATSALAAPAPSPAPAPAAPAPAAAPAAPNTPAQDAAIAMAKMLNPTSSPKLTSNGAFAYLNVALADGRTELVYVSTTTFGPADGKLRLIMAEVYLPAAPDAALMTRLLKESKNGLPYGYWALSAAADGTAIVSYNVEVQLDTKASVVQEVMSTVATRTDALEKELTGKDDH